MYLTNLVKLEGFTHIIFSVSSANLENCKYSPIPFTYRVIAIDRFISGLISTGKLSSVTWSIVAIPHYVGLAGDIYCKRCLSQISTEVNAKLTTRNSQVLISTPALKAEWGLLGFRTHGCELTQAKQLRVFPVNILEGVVTHSSLDNASNSSVKFLQDYPNIAKVIRSLWNNPVSVTGTIGEQRDYSSYSTGMQSNMHVKYQTIKPYIIEGVITDEGCADGALLSEISKEFKDSEFYGIDLSNEFAGRFQERIRAGGFFGKFAHFILGDLLKKQFKPNSVATSICNSTTHEIFSYCGKGNREKGSKAVRKFLKLKFKQLQKGGTLIIRDIAGMEQPAKPVYLTTPGNLSDTFESSISTRFSNFTQEFKWHNGTSRAVETTTNLVTWQTTLEMAMEFAHRFEYVDSWKSELLECYGFWSLSKWIKELEEIGFTVHQAKYLQEDWLVQNRLSKLELSTGWPATHHLIVANKP